MDNYTLNDLEQHFEVKKEEAALVFIFLTLLPPGASLTLLNGQIEKITEDTFRLIVDKNTYHRIADDFLTEGVEDYEEIFSKDILGVDETWLESDDS